MKELQNEWEWKKLGEVCEIYNGSTPSRNKKEYWGGDILWATPTDVSNLCAKYIIDTKEKITHEGYESCSTHLLPKNSVIFTSRASIGHIAITKIELCTNQGFKNFVCKKELLPEFLFYCLKMKKKEIENLGSGSTFKEVSMSVIKQVEIPVPPLEIQTKIVSILERAEKLKEQRKLANEETNKIIQSLFYEMFGDNKYPQEQILGHIEEVTSRDPTKKPDDFFEYVDIAGIDNQTGRIKESKELLGKEAPSRARREIREHDIIVSTVRPNLNATALIPKELNNQICSTGFCVIRCKKRLIQGIFSQLHDKRNL